MMKDPGSPSPLSSSLSGSSKASTSKTNSAQASSTASADAVAKASGKASRVSSGPGPLQEADLAARLAQAEAELREHSGPSSAADSEERDHLRNALQAEEESEADLQCTSRPSSRPSSKPSSEVATPRDLRSQSTEVTQEDRCRVKTRDFMSSFLSDSKSGSSSSVSHDKHHYTSGSDDKHHHTSSEEDPHSSTSSSSINQHRTQKELWELLVFQQEKNMKSEDTVTELRQMMASMAEKHGMEIEGMQRQLRKMLKRELGKCQEKAFMTSQVAAMEAKHAERAEELKEMTQALTDVKKQLEREKGDHKDWIAGQEARTSTKIKNLSNEYNLKLDEERMEQEEARKAKDEMKVEWVAQNSVLEKELALSKVASKNATAERDVLRRNMQMLQTSHQQHVNSLKEQLDVANQALTKVTVHEDRTSCGTAPARPNVDPDSTDKSDSQVVNLRDELAQQRETHREMSYELSELRVKMLGMQQIAEAQPDSSSSTEVGDLQMLLDAANVHLEDLDIDGVAKSSQSLKLPVRTRFPAGPKKTRAKGKGMILLTSIEEDDMSSMDGSIAASGNVSSDGGDEVGNLHDFDENSATFPDQSQSKGFVQQVEEEKREMNSRIKELKEKLAQDHKSWDEAKEELAENEARHASKVARLMDVVDQANDSKAKVVQELSDLRSGTKRKDAEHEAEIFALQEMLACSENRYAVALQEQQQISFTSTLASKSVASAPAPEGEADKGHEHLWNQLCGALEAKRILEGRVEEFQRAMTAMERQHNELLSELKQQRMAAGSTAAKGNADLEELEDLRQQLRSSNEERNVLANSIEWKEVQWKSKVENMEMNHGAAMAELRRKHDAELKELRSTLEGELSEARQSLEDAKKERSKLLEKSREAVSPTLAPSWLARLRCPTRGNSSSSSSAECAAFCQDMCWRILNSISGITALLCSSNDFKILQATRNACMIWGSSALHGQSILTLVNGPSRAAWLRKAFQMNQSVADTQHEGVPGFAVRDLGCEEFTSKQGQPFDSSVLTAHLPAEPACSKEAALLIIIEPQGVQRAGSASGAAAVGNPATSSAPSAAAAHQHPPMGRVDAARGNQSSAHSEVSTIDPSDSASNIFDRNMGLGMFARG